MRAREFEVRHQELLRFLLIAAAFLTYLFQRDDVVWAWVKGSPQSRLLERALFAVATLFIGGGATICTWMRTMALSGHNAIQPHRDVRFLRHLGVFFYSVGLASLAPLSGLIILVVGQAFLGFRLLRHSSARAQPEVAPLLPASSLSQAVRQEAGKWGLFFTMSVFTLLLLDRVAEILAVASFVLWAILNLPQFHRTPAPQKGSSL